MSDNILVLKDINKGFFGAKVLHDINLEVKKGEILGLVGENGAGKSTLMNILGGVLPYDSGSMFLNDQAYQPSTPKDAQKAGIAFIHQELNLFTNLSVAENMFIDELPLGSMWSVKYKEMEDKARSYIDTFGVDTTPRAKVESLPMGIRQTVEITKALMKEAGIIIFDEPTTSLSHKEKENLFKIIQQLKGQGVTIIYISHILEDVFLLCDRIAVLRDGHMIGTENKEALDKARVIKMMVGRELSQVYPTIEKSIGETSFEVRNIRHGSAVQDVSFSLHSGEIVGLFGLMGAGRTELVRCLFGVDKMDAGEIYVHGSLLKNPSPQNCIKEGMAFITEDRRQEGLFMPKSVKENLVMVKLDQLLGLFGVVNRKKEEQETLKAVKELSIKVQNRNTQAVKNLSGGNQQKVVIGKWVMRDPSIFIMDEPTRGVDVGAKAEIYTIINQMAKNGATVIFISSEMEELMGVCDRILVMCRNKMVADIPRDEYEQGKIISYALEGCN